MEPTNCSTTTPSSPPKTPTKSKTNDGGTLFSLPVSSSSSSTISTSLPLLNITTTTTTTNEQQQQQEKEEEKQDDNKNMMMEFPTDYNKSTSNIPTTISTSTPTTPQGRMTKSNSFSSNRRPIFRPSAHNENLIKIRDHTLLQSFQSKYVVEVLGNVVMGYGGTSIVMKGKRRLDSLNVAVKFIFKDRIPVTKWIRDKKLGGTVPLEASVLRRLDHENIIKFLDCFEDMEFCYLVMEAHGGDDFNPQKEQHLYNLNNNNLNNNTKNEQDADDDDEASGNKSDLLAIPPHMFANDVSTTSLSSSSSSSVSSFTSQSSSMSLLLEEHKEESGQDGVLSRKGVDIVKKPTSERGGGHVRSNTDGFSLSVPISFASLPTSPNRHHHHTHNAHHHHHHHRKQHKHFSVAGTSRHSIFTSTASSSSSSPTIQGNSSSNDNRKTTTTIPTEQNPETSEKSSIDNNNNTTPAMDLFEFFSGTVDRSIPEDKCRPIIKQVISALAYMHSLHVVHGDIKPENILVDGNWNVKLIDFGGSLILPDKNVMYDTRCFHGTIQYAPPEIFSKIDSVQKYNPIQCEMWSLGVLIATLVTGERPFKDLNFSKKPKFDIDNTTPEIRDLVFRLLVDESGGRLSAFGCLEHPWYMLD